MARLLLETPATLLITREILLRIGTFCSNYRDDSVSLRSEGSRPHAPMAFPSRSLFPRSRKIMSLTVNAVPVELRLVRNRKPNPIALSDRNADVLLGQGFDMFLVSGHQATSNNLVMRAVAFMYSRLFPSLSLFPCQRQPDA